jgi:hypothetical protein
MICLSKYRRILKYFDEPGALYRWLVDSTGAIQKGQTAQDFIPDVKFACFVWKKLHQ